MAWSFNKHTPVYKQIADRIRRSIISGEYPPNSQIPAVRQLAVTAAANPNTVQRALTELENEGIIYSKGTIGRFVTSDAQLLDAAKKQAAKKLVQEFTEQAKQMSISKAQLIKMIEGEDI